MKLIFIGQVFLEIFVNKVCVNFLFVQYIYPNLTFIKLNLVSIDMANNSGKCLTISSCNINEPRHERTNVLVSGHARHKSGCTGW